MRGSALVGLACAAAGCVPIDPYRGLTDDAPAGELTGLSVMGSGDERIEVRGEQFMVAFPGARSEPRYPDTIELGGTSVLGEDTACSGDDKVGVRLIPAFTSTRIPNTLGPVLDITSKGEAYVKTELIWQFSYNCDGAPQVASGTTWFSFFPDGRIVRYDNVSPSSVTLATGGPVNCYCLQGAAPTNYWLQSHLALKNSVFARYHFARVDAPAVVQSASLPVDAESFGETSWITSPNPIWACVGPEAGATSGPAVGIVWISPSEAAEDNGTRIKEHNGGLYDTTIFIWDWLYGHVGSNAVAPGPYEASATWYLGTGGDAMCHGPVMQARNDAFNTPATLTLMWDSGGSEPVGLDRTIGVYRWDPASPPVNAPRRYDVRAGIAIPTSHALSVLLPSDQVPTVQRNGAMLRHRVDYLWQAETVVLSEHFRHTLWFPGPWASTEDVLTILQ